VNLVPPPVYGALSLIAMWWLHHTEPLACTDAKWPIVIGWIYVVLGLAIDVIAILQFRKRNTTINPLKPQNSSTLITNGLYRFTRNPMYLGMALLLLGVALIMRCLSPMFVPIVFCVIVTGVQILPEERILTQKFGDDFRQYRRRVRRWF